MDCPDRCCQRSQYLETGFLPFYLGIAPAHIAQDGSVIARLRFNALLFSGFNELDVAALFIEEPLTRAHCDNCVLESNHTAATWAETIRTKLKLLLRSDDHPDRRANRPRYGAPCSCGLRTSSTS